MSGFWILLISTVVVGIGSYLMRSVFILALADRQFPPVVQEALRYVAPAVMAALVVSLSFGGAGQSGWVEAVALGVGGLVGWRSRSLVWVLVAGMGTLWLLRWLV
ncbi:MAG TPA: AzlD domain-containing protein [Acidimicrobiia bacterium]|nr:AzlD domain-containing protein [Acidimicrobiia bacterium]